MIKTKEEIKYQFIKLVKSGRTVKESMALAKAVSGSLLEEYIDNPDLVYLQSLQGGMNDIKMKKNVDNIHFKPKRKLMMNREDSLASFLVYHDERGLRWARDGNLVRKGRPNKPRPGSSRGKIGKTRVVGAKEVVRDFEKLIIALRRLQASGDKKAFRAGSDKLQKAYNSIKTDINVKGGKG